MRKFMLLILIFTCLLLAISLPIFAGEKVIIKEEQSKNRDTPPLKVNINLYRTYHNPTYFIFDWYQYKRSHAIGVKFQILPNYYSTFNCEYDSLSNDLLLSLGALYRIPREIILWHFYLGGEYTFSRNNLYGDPYLLFGTDFLVFFWESKLPVTRRGNPVTRGGFRFNF